MAFQILDLPRKTSDSTSKGWAFDDRETLAGSSGLHLKNALSRALFTVIKHHQLELGEAGMPQPLPIAVVAEKLGLGGDDVEPYGWFKGKLALGLEQRLPPRNRAKYVGVTAINPTPLGEGKTVTAIGLAMALCREGHQAIVTLRQPSQGPVFGIKGGGAGAGRASLLPADDINLHFTGDLHAVTSAHNLLAALLDNHIQRARTPLIEPKSVSWRRVIDLNDKGLAHIISGLDNTPQAPLRETGFDLTAASEVMAILALAGSLEDLRQRLGRIIVGETPSGHPVTAHDIGATGAMAALLRNAIRPNLVQTCEHTPALVHAGPFANIAHGNSSILADIAAMKLADYVVTESGFGADCGAEKFIDIKCRLSGLCPSAEVLVCTVRALKFHSGRFVMKPGQPVPSSLLQENIDALRVGAVNLQAHLELLQRTGVPTVVALNRFPDDSDREIESVRQLAIDFGATAFAVSDAFEGGGAGAIELARAVKTACEQTTPLKFFYPLDMRIEEKLATIVRNVYGGDGIELEALASHRIAKFRDWGYEHLPICIAKTQYSLSHNPDWLGRPTGFRLPIRDIRLAAGAGFLYALAGEISTMPGLPRDPAALRIDVTDDGTITGL